MTAYFPVFGHVSVLSAGVHFRAAKTPRLQRKEKILSVFETFSFSLFPEKRPSFAERPRWRKSQISQGQKLLNSLALETWKQRWQNRQEIRAKVEGKNIHPIWVMTAKSPRETFNRQPAICLEIFAHILSSYMNFLQADHQLDFLFASKAYREPVEMWIDLNSPRRALRGSNVVKWSLRLKFPKSLRFPRPVRGRRITQE